MYDLVIVGAGPAGIFTALELVRKKSRKKILMVEKGNPVQGRRCPKNVTGQCVNCKPYCHITTGFSGAGAFSDGKLNTGTRDPRHRFILEQLTACGAPEDILIDAKPHVGTDYLHVVLVNLRAKLLALGADIRFSHQLTGLSVQAGQLDALTVEGPEGAYRLPCSRLILCPCLLYTSPSPRDRG